MFEEPRLRGDSTLDQKREEDEPLAEAEERPAPGKVPRVLRYQRDALRREGYMDEARRRATAAGITPPALPWGVMPGDSAALGTVFRKQSGEPAADDVAVTNLHRAQQSAGDLLPTGLRLQLERALQTDLSGVRIHTGSASASASEAIGARAYAIGQDIHFAAGQFDPASAGGRELIAHEVAHTVQQGGVSRTASPTLRLSRSADPHEREADRFAEGFAAAPAAAAHGAVSPGGATGAVVYRKGSALSAAIGTDEGKAKDALAKARGAGQGGTIEAIIRANFDKETAEKIIKSAPPAVKAPEVKGADAKPEPGGKGKGDGGKGGGAKGGGDSGAAGGKGASGSAEGGSAPAPAGAPAAAAGLADLSAGELGLIHQELIEHEMWQSAADVVGDITTAKGQAQRAAFIGENVGKGAISGFATGFVMGAGAAIVGKLATKFVPIPGVGSMIAGGMAAYGLATKDWGAALDTVSKMGEGEGYEYLANLIAGVSEILDTLCNIANVIAGLIGLVAAIMWIVTIITVGVAAPLATTLSAIAIGITAVTGAIGLINDQVLSPLVLLFRVLGAFTSTADPRDVEAKGAGLQDSASKVGGALGGIAGGAAVNKGASAGKRGIHKVKKARAGRKGSPAKTKAKPKPTKKGPAAKKKGGKSGSKPNQRNKRKTEKSKKKEQAKKKDPQQDREEANADNQSRWDRYKNNAKKAHADYKKRLDDLKAAERQHQKDLDDPAGAAQRKQQELDDALAASKKVTDAEQSSATKAEANTARAKAAKAANKEAIGEAYSKKVKAAANKRNAAKKSANKKLDDELNKFEQTHKQKHSDKQSAVNAEKTLLKKAHSEARDRSNQIEDPAQRAAEKKNWDDLYAQRKAECDGEKRANEAAYRNQRKAKLDDVRSRRTAAKRAADSEFEADKGRAAAGKAKAMEEHGKLCKEIDDKLEQDNKGYKDDAAAADQKRAALDEQHADKSKTDPAKAEWESKGNWTGGKNTSSMPAKNETKPGWVWRKFKDSHFIKPFVDIPSKFKAPHQRDALGNPVDQPSSAQTDDSAGGTAKLLDFGKKDVDSGLKKTLLSGHEKTKEDKDKDKADKAKLDAEAKADDLGFIDKSILANEKKQAAHQQQFAEDSQLDTEGDKSAADHPNPNYQPPPCSPEDLDAIKDGILTNLEKKAEAEALEKKSAGDAAKAGGDVKGLTKLGGEASASISASEAHAQAVARKDKANAAQKGREENATGMISTAAQKKAGFAVLKGPLGMVSSFAWIGEKVPNQSLIKIGTDSKNLLKAITAAETAIDAEEAKTPAREQAHTAQGAKIKAVGAKGEQTKATSLKNKSAVEGHKAASEAEQDSAKAAASEASADAAERDAAANEGKTKRASMAQQLSAWAAAHKAERMRAMQEAGLIEIEEAPPAEGVATDDDAEPEPDAGAARGNADPGNAAAPTATPAAEPAPAAEPVAPGAAPGTAPSGAEPPAPSGEPGATPAAAPDGEPATTPEPEPAPGAPTEGAPA